MSPPEPVPKGWFQERGRRFERVIRRILEEARLEPRTNYRPSGEEIDGSFVAGGRYYLFEAKWKKITTPASEIYAFKGKVDGKLIGTLGIFFSMSGYSPDAVDALIAGKELNLILFSPEDIVAISEGEFAFVDALNHKLRAAAEEGTPLRPLKAIATLQPRDKDQDVSVGNAAEPLPLIQWTFIVKERADEAALQSIFESMPNRPRLLIRFWVAGGALNFPAVVRAAKDSRPHSKVVAFVDQEFPPEQASDLLTEAVDIVKIEPSVEEWVTRAVDTDFYNLTMPSTTHEVFMRKLGRNADLQSLRDGSADFDELLKMMKL